MRHAPCRLQPRPPCGRAAGGAPCSHSTFTPQVTAAVTCHQCRGGAVLGGLPRGCDQAHRRGHRRERADLHRLQVVRGGVPLRRHPSPRARPRRALPASPIPLPLSRGAHRLCWLGASASTPAPSSATCAPPWAPTRSPIASKRVRPRRSTCAMPRRSRAFARTRCAPPWRPTRS